MLIRLLAAFGLLTLSACDKPVPLLEHKCGSCHSTQQIYHQRRTPEGWRQVIHGMKQRGLKLTAEDERQVLRILEENYGL